MRIRSRAVVLGPHSFACVLLLLGTPWLASCGLGDPCRHSCLATSVTLLVETSPDGGDVPGVQAILTPSAGASETDGGAPSDGFSGMCQPNYNVTTSGSKTSTGTANCFWYAASLAAGSYTVQVSADGYQPVNLPVTLSFPPHQCNCVFAVIAPKTVILTPADGGTLAPADGG